MCHSSSPPHFWVSTLQTLVILNTGSRVVEDPAALMWICWFLAAVIALREDHVLQRPQSPGLPQPLQLQGQALSVGSQPLSCPCEAHLVTGSSLLWGSAFHAWRSAPGRCLWALSGFVSPFSSAPGAALAIIPRFPGKPGWQGQQDGREGIWGPAAVAAVPGPPALCSAGQLRSSPRK